MIFGLPRIGTEDAVRSKRILRRSQYGAAARKNVDLCNNMWKIKFNKVQ